VLPKRDVYQRGMKEARTQLRNTWPPMEENNGHGILLLGEQGHEMDFQVLDFLSKLGEAVYSGLCGPPGLQHQL
jgi:hypothetical protein